MNLGNKELDSILSSGASAAVDLGLAERRGIWLIWSLMDFWKVKTGMWGIRP